MSLFPVSVGEELGDANRVIYSENSAIFPYPCTSSTSCTYYSVYLSPGVYLLEAWGSQGGNDTTYPTACFGGRGGYSRAELSLSSKTYIHIYVGGAGTGDIRSLWGSTGGGGATDFRLMSGLWNSSMGLNSRILIAGGGGGRTGNNYEDYEYVGNDGGGSSAPTFSSKGFTVIGATKDSGGSSTHYDKVEGSFGYANPTPQTNTYSLGGYNGGSRGSDNWANGGAGGGWYGGCTSSPTGSGGSGFVLNTSTAPPEYPVSPEYYLSSGFTISGQTSFLDPFDNPEIGHSGNGAAKITIISTNAHHNIGHSISINCISFYKMPYFFISLFKLLIS